MSEINCYDYATDFPVPFSPPSSDSISVCQLRMPSHFKDESPYWYPSSEEEELVKELEKLKLKFFDKAELE